jgi:hypothetical protein
MAVRSYTHSMFSALVALALAGCGGRPSVGAMAQTSLGPAETFEWTDHPIAFAPPDERWARESERSGGLLGARFVKQRSMGEAIEVAEYYVIGQRDGRASLADLLQKLDSYDDRDLRRQLSLARYRTDDPINPLETDVATRVNEALDRAMLAHIHGDADAVRAAVHDAQFAADGMRFSLADGIERVAFDPAKRNDPSMYTVTSRGTTTVAGEPAITVDYTVKLPERTMAAREVYWAHDNHLFVASFIGLAQNLELFDRVVASVTWPGRAKA